MLAAQRWRATDWEVAQFVRCCRRMKHLPGIAARTLNSIAQSKSTNWYVRQQAVLTMGWFRLPRQITLLSRILFTEWDEEVRRAILTAIFMLSTRDENLLLRRATRDEAPKVSRMANYLLALREDAALAQASLKQFGQPNEIFFCDNFWKLYQIKRNSDTGTQNAFHRVLAKTTKELPSGPARKHLRALGR